MFLTYNDICASLSLTPRETDIGFTGISTDTRTIKPGMLFVALRGENFNGHDYVGRAFELGASAAVVDHFSADRLGPQIHVPDTLIAYGRIASLWRSRFSIPVVGVTGSVGKTTLKEMTALALSPLGPVLKTEKNENNEVGLPKTLLRLDSQHRAVVLEMGMRGFGQIKYLAEVARPTVGVITVIGESHIEIVGSRLGIADAKGELIDSLGQDDTVVLNADDSFFDHLSSKVHCRLITYGRAPNADIAVTSVVQHDEGWLVLLKIGHDLHPLLVHSPAIHDVQNAAGAIAVAVASGVVPADAVAALLNYRPSNMRMELLSSRSGATILSDCYNAAPVSMRAALHTLADMRHTGIKSAFLGDMRELGEFSEEMHRDIATVASRLAIENIYAVGEFMPSAFPSAKRSFPKSADAAAFVAESFSLNSGDVVLVKGSRAIELEKVVEALVQL